MPSNRNGATKRKTVVSNVLLNRCVEVLNDGGYVCDNQQSERPSREGGFGGLGATSLLYDNSGAFVGPIHWSTMRWLQQNGYAARGKDLKYCNEAQA